MTGPRQLSVDPIIVCMQVAATLRKESMPSKMRRVGSAAAMPKGGSTGSFGDLRAQGVLPSPVLNLIHGISHNDFKYTA